jgi:hypothetical protein
VGQPFLAARRAVLECGGLVIMSLEGPPLSRLKQYPDVSEEHKVLGSGEQLFLGRRYLRPVHTLCIPSPCPIRSLRSGHPRSLTRPTNRFSLGVVLYETLFDAPAGRVTDETGLLPVGRQLRSRIRAKPAIVVTRRKSVGQTYKNT